MRKFIYGVVVSISLIALYSYYQKKQRQSAELKEASVLIEQSIKNVSKLIVTEGHFAEVFSYKDAKNIMDLSFLKAKKEALMAVNTKAIVSYDLSQITYDLDAKTKTVRITHLPEPELSISPEITYHSITQDYLNPFDQDDYNRIKSQVVKKMEKKIKASSFYSNAQNRLISELQKILLLTNSLGWTLEHTSSLQNFELENVAPVQP